MSDDQYDIRKCELLERQADLAEKRTRLSQERTFASWLRTSLAFVAAGLGIAELLESTVDPRLPTVIGVVLVVTGGGVFAVAFLRYGAEWLAARRGLRFLVLAMVVLAGVSLAVVLALVLLLNGG